MLDAHQLKTLADQAMADQNINQTIQKTEWTDSLLEDLIAALKGERDDATVRAFAQELINDKGLPVTNLVQKVKAALGNSAFERLDVLVRGRHAIEKAEAEAEKAKSTDGVRGLLRNFFG
jgi:hypothetical protein